MRKTKSNDDTGLKCACHDDKGKTKRKDLLVESGKKTVKEEAKKKKEKKNSGLTGSTKKVLYVIELPVL